MDAPRAGVSPSVSYGVVVTAASGPTRRSVTVSSPAKKPVEDADRPVTVTVRRWVPAVSDTEPSRRRPGALHRARVPSKSWPTATPSTAKRSVP
ncbi:hypothetical protein V2I01_25280 [Micromonospora sp. BRA006-A]|nr:hypothetical protein [Micromonospora sp. BRA006-A]